MCAASIMQIKPLVLSLALAGCLGWAPWSLAAPGPEAAGPAAPLDRSGEDPAVRPQDDLFRAFNGGWLRNTPIPQDKSTYGNFTLLHDRADERVRTLVEGLTSETAAVGSVERKVADLYRAFMDEPAMDAAGLKPLQPTLARLAALRNGHDLALVLGELQGRVELPLVLDVQPDQKAPERYLPLTWQGGLGLPSRDYYLASDARMVKARGAYLRYLVTLFTLQGADETRASHQAALVMALETRLAKAQFSEVDNRNPQKVWNPMTLQALQRLAPGLDWAAFFNASSLPGLDRLNVSQPGYARELALAVRQVPIATWSLYLQARVMDGSSNMLGQPWREASFAFHGMALQGRPSPTPRWQQGMAALDAALGEAVGQLYVARHFPADHKARMQQLVGWLMQAYGQSIDQLTWMGPATKQKARDKLAHYAIKIGYPDRWRDYSALQVRADDPVGNALRAGRFNLERQTARVRQPVDRQEWYLTPQTVNAYYNPAMNEIVFPAAILEPPFFDIQADDATNFGAIGAVIGHEISHGFDDAGAQYDGQGRLSNWWTPQDQKAFKALGERLVAQFNRYEPLPGQKINGQLTLGENMADLSGLEIAFKAWKLSLGGKPAPVIDGLTGEQRFFRAFAVLWRSKQREELMLQRLVADPHSPSEFRANGAVVNIDSFHETFGTRPGDKLYKPSEARIRIW
jgi:putative endopeptidase